MDNLYFMEIKIFFFSQKVPIGKWNGKLETGRKYCKIYSHKGLVPRIHKGVLFFSFYYYYWSIVEMIKNS